MSRFTLSAPVLPALIANGNIRARALSVLTLFLLAMAPCGTAWAHVPSKATPDAATNTATPGTTPIAATVVPLKQHAQAMLVDARLNHSQTATFVVDTGATYTAISRDMAIALGLDLAGAEHITLATANGRIEVPKVTIASLDVNGLEAKNVEATVLDIRRGGQFTGLLGLSFLRQFRLTFDPVANQLIFEPISAAVVARP